VSIVVTVLDSHEVVHRQLEYLNRVCPTDMELILVDDGSVPEIPVPDCAFPVTVHRTHDPHPWTERQARRAGVALARSERLVCVDIDHIVTRALLEFVSGTAYDYIKFRRAFGTLDAQGVLHTDVDSVAAYGVPPERLRHRGTHLSPPGNCYAMSKRLFQTLCDSAWTKRRLQHCVGSLARRGQCTRCPGPERPLVYMIPNGRYAGELDGNPFGLFHHLSRDSEAYRQSERVLI
jgi:hypothetical protein